MRKPAASLALAIVAMAAVLEPLVTAGWGSGAPAWSHWWCSPAALRSLAHSGGGGGLGATALTALEVHWPHFLPILPALATLVYLWRANRARARSAPSRWLASGANPSRALTGES